MSDASNDTQLWRVVSADGTVHEVEVYRDTGGWFTSATGSVGLATPRAAAQTHAEECHWCVAEILAPGQRSRAEVERERDALHAVVAALPPCHACATMATCLDVREFPVEMPCCDAHAPTGPWTAMDLPYADALRAWRGAR